MTYKNDFAHQFFMPLLANSLVHEFTSDIYVSRKAKDCYYEDCQPGAQYTFNFEVKSGASVTTKGYVKGYVTHPNGTVVYPDNTAPSSENTIKGICNSHGDYEFCVDNTEDRLATKRVAIHIVIAHIPEVTGFHAKKHLSPNKSITYNLFDKSFQISHDILDVKLKTESMQNMHERDWDLMKTNHEYVAYTSFAAICLMILVGYGQILSIKRMFQSNEVVANGKTALRL
ncbi:transmembrane emp24 domain-containing protein 5-like [Ciona intestinalis]